MSRDPFLARRYGQTSAMPSLIRLWLLRLLVPLNCQREFIGASGFGNDSLAEVMGLEEWIDASSHDFAPRAIRAELKRLHLDAERRQRKAKPPRELVTNVRQLARLVGLSATECRVLEFPVLIHSESLLDDAADWLGNLSSVKVHRVLATLLGITESDIRASLCAQGILGRSGLVSMNRTGVSTLRGKLELLSERFADLMLSPKADPVALIISDQNRLVRCSNAIAHPLRYLCRAGR